MNKKISIILGYRNRESERVKNCLDSLERQTYKNFEVIFIDYGSDEHFSRAIKPLVEAYPFAHYFYNHTLGMPWNRSHALNTGVRLASYEYILFGDIDLIYSNEVLQSLVSISSENNQVFSNVYYLPKGLNDLNKIMESNWTNLNCSINSKGGVHLIQKEKILKIRGFDEYYCFWGVEDRDLYERLNRIGIISERINNLQYPVFHQWHPDVSISKDSFFPDRWWESMNIHYQLYIDILERNDQSWGKLYTISDRKIFNTKEVPLQYNHSGNWFYKGKVAIKLIEAVQQLNHDECLKIEIPVFAEKRKGIIGFVNKLLRVVHRNYALEKKETIRFNAHRDLYYIIWELIKKNELVKDYYINNNQYNIIFKIMKRQN